MAQGGLEIFLIRTLPHRQSSERCRFPAPSLNWGNTNKVRTQRVMQNFKIEVDPNKEELFSGLYETTQLYSSRTSSLIWMNKRLRGKWWFCSHMVGKFKEDRHCGIEIDAATKEQRRIFYINFPRQAHEELHIENILIYGRLAIFISSYPDHLIFYDIKELAEGGRVSIKGRFHDAVTYRNEVWMIKSLNYTTDEAIVQLDMRRINFRMTDAQVPKLNVVETPLDHATGFRSTITLDTKSVVQPANSLLVDRYHCYISLRDKLMCYDKKSGALVKKIKYPASNLDQVAGRGTSIFFVATHVTLTAWRSPSLQMITSVDLPCFERFNDRKRWTVVVVGKVELVFAVGLATATITVACLLGYKLHLIAKRTDFLTTAMVKKEEYRGFPQFYLEPSNHRMHIFGVQMPISYNLSW